MGCVRQRTPGSWQILYYHEGRQKSRTIKGTKRDAERLLREVERSIDLGEYASSPKRSVTVGDVLRDWLGEVRDRREVTTYQRYEQAVRLHLLPAFGGVPLASLKPGDIRAVYKQWGSGAEMNHRVLSAALAWAVRMELAERNASTPVAPPRGQQSSFGGALTREEVLLLLREAPDKPYGGQTVLALTTGMRRGEISGLRWENVHIDQRFLRVRDAVARLTGGDVIRKDPKTKTSLRLVVLPRHAVEILSGLPKEGEYVFGGSCPINPAALSSGVSRLCHKLGVKTTLHGLRHAHASLLNRIGGNLLAVQDRLGHSSLEQTLDYTHLLLSQQRELSDLFDDATREQ